MFRQGEQDYYRAIIKSVGGTTFSIEKAVAGGKDLTLEAGFEFRATLFGSDALYHFDTRVVMVSRKEGEPEYFFEYPAEMHRHQRRSYVRVPCRLNVYCWILDEAMQALSQMVISGEEIPLEDSRWNKGLLEELNSKIPAMQGVTLDLSGGGVRMVVRELVRRQERLILKICIDERCHQYFLLEGRVVRVVPLSIRSLKKCRVGVVFVNVSQGLRERIIRYIFSTMRKRV